MKTIGIVAEYNPFHEGHKYHIEESKRLTGGETVIAVMSGNYVQRGEPAAIDKFIRAKMALLQGVDLVVEIPAKFVLGDASTFAGAAVAILKALGVDCISFGSEAGEISKLKQIAELLAEEPAEYREKLKVFLEKGVSFAAARSAACEELIQGAGDLLHRSNNILAVEYLRQLELQKTSVKAVTVARKGMNYGELTLKEGSYPSAAAIRNRMDKTVEKSKIDDLLPKKSLDVIEEINGTVKCEINDYFDILSAKFLTSSKKNLESLYGASEGITNRIYSNLLGIKTIEELDERVVSKRYSVTRLHRLYMQAILGIYKDELKNAYEKYISGEGSYIRVLGFTEKGRTAIREIKNSLPEGWILLTNINKEREFLSEEALKLLDFEINATSLYNIVNKKDSYKFSDFVRRPVIISKF